MSDRHRSSIKSRLNATSFYSSFSDGVVPMLLVVGGGVVLDAGVVVISCCLLSCSCSSTLAENHSDDLFFFVVLPVPIPSYILSLVVMARADRLPVPQL